MRWSIWTVGMAVLLGTSFAGCTDFLGSCLDENTVPHRIVPNEPRDIVEPGLDYFGSAVSIHHAPASLGWSGDLEIEARQFNPQQSEFALEAKYPPRSLISHAVNYENLGYSRPASIATHGLWTAMGVNPGSIHGKRPTAETPGFAIVRHYSSTQTTTLSAQDPQRWNEFGTSMAMDSDRLVVGAPGAAPKWGAVYVFELKAGKWNQAAKISAPNEETEPRVYEALLFGEAVAISNDTIAIGAPSTSFEFMSELRDWTGAVFIFRLNGTEWEYEDLVYQPRTPPGQGPIGIFYGQSVALENDTLVVGQPSIGDNSDDGGAAYVYRRQGKDWSLESVLRAPGCNQQDWFGESVALSGDRIVVGAPRDTRFDGTGSAFVFARSGTTWSLVNALEPHGGEAGMSVAIHGDRILVGAPRAGDGRVYLYDPNLPPAMP